VDLPVRPHATPGAPFFGIYYSSFYTDSSGSPTRTTLLGSTRGMAPGQYWIVGQLVVDAGRLVDRLSDQEETGTSIAQFGNTAQLYLDAAPTSPDAVVFTTSGFDYRPVPEPDGMALVGIGALCLVARLGRPSSSHAGRPTFSVAGAAGLPAPPTPRACRRG
jgi:hypothetical protein